MRKVFKISVVMCAVFALLSLSVLSVGALSMDVYLNPTFFTLEENKITYNGTDWLDPSHSNFTFDSTNSNFGRLTFSTYADQSIPGSNTLQYWRAKFKPTSEFSSSFNTTPYMQLSISLYYTQNVSPSYSPQYINGALYFTVPNGMTDGVTYEFPIVNQITVETPEGQFLGYYLQFEGVMDITRGFNLKDCTYEFICSGVTNATAVDLEFRDFKFVMLENISEDTVKVVESVDKGFSDLKEALDKNTQDIINNNNTNTDKITGSIEDSTDEILNGWETDDDTAGETDNAVGSLGSAEDEALGGKTDEQIKEEINGAFGSVTFPSETPKNVLAVSSMFEDLLDVFGAKYQSLLMLSLVLGLGAFLVGRQFKAKE